MSVQTTKRLAARILKCGESRVRILDAKKAKEALTAEDVRALAAQGIIVVLQKKGVGRGKAKIKQSRKESGRRRGQGSKKGENRANETRKERWMKKARSQRKILRAHKNSLAQGEHKKLYSMVKGNYFKSKKHLLAEITESTAKK